MAYALHASPEEDLALLSYSGETTARDFFAGAEVLYSPGYVPDRQVIVDCRAITTLLLLPGELGELAACIGRLTARVGQRIEGERREREVIISRPDGPHGSEIIFPLYAVLAKRAGYEVLLCATMAEALEAVGRTELPDPSAEVPGRGLPVGTRQADLWQTDLLPAGVQAKPHGVGPRRPLGAGARRQASSPEARARPTGSSSRSRRRWGTSGEPSFPSRPFLGRAAFRSLSPRAFAPITREKRKGPADRPKA